MAVALLPVAPSAADSATAFPDVAQAFFMALQRMVTEVNAFTSTFATPLSTLAGLPVQDGVNFVSGADGFVASVPDLVADVNGMIAELSLACGNITTLPATPSRTSDAANFVNEGPAFLAALPTMRTQLNAFITALNALDHGQLLLSGDMQGGTTDSILLSGDMQSGADNLTLSGSY